MEVNLTAELFGLRFWVGDKITGGLRKFAIMDMIYSCIVGILKSRLFHCNADTRCLC